jgi:hypothetical protein
MTGSGSGSVSVGGGGGASIDLTGYATEMWTDENYVGKEFFSSLFKAYDANGNEVLPNDTETEIDNIKAMFGFWTDFYVSALGTGGQQSVGLRLAQLADVNVAGVQNDQVLKYDATSQKWVPGTASSGTDMATVWANLAASGNQQIDYSHISGAVSLSNGTITIGSSSITPITSHQSLAGYAKEQWVSQNFLALTGGTVTGWVKILQLKIENTNEINGYSNNGADGNAHINYSSSGNVSLANGGGNVCIGGTTYTHKLNVAGNIATSASNGSFVQIGAIRLEYDNTNNALKVVKSDGTSANFYATGGVSALGYGSSGESIYLPKSGGTMTGLLKVATGVGIDDASGGGLLVYHPTDWTGVSSSQWGVGSAQAQGVIRSSDSVLKHYRNGDGSYDIIESKGGQSISNSLQVASLKLEKDNEINSYYSSGNLCLQHSQSGNTIICKAGGKVGIGAGATSPSYKLHVDGSVGATSFNNTSDIRRKKDMSDIALTVEQIANAPVFTFFWNDGTDEDQHAGTSAQYWQNVMPQVVTAANDEMQTLSMQYDVPALIAATILARKVEDHESRLRRLEKMFALNENDIED